MGDVVGRAVAGIEARDGWVGWALIGVVVLAWNGRCVAAVRAGREPHEMLSTFAGRHRYRFVALLAYLACHFCAWPRQLARYDPLHLFFTHLAE